MEDLLGPLPMVLLLRISSSKISPGPRRLRGRIIMCYVEREVVRMFRLKM